MSAIIQATPRHLERLEQLRVAYGRFPNKHRELHQLQEDYGEFRSLISLCGKPDDNMLLEACFWKLHEALNDFEAAAKAECPIGWARPTYWQAQMLNAWHPDYEPDAAVDGYQFVANFGGVRSVKTTGVVFNQILWCIPNDPDWRFFEPYRDDQGREVRVLPRFRWDEWQRTGRRVLDPSEPPKEACENWHGCVDENHWKDKLEKEYRKWIPKREIALREDGSPIWMVAEKTFQFRFGSTVTAKLYNSDMNAWSGKELFCISLDEGVPKDKFDEAKIRCEYMMWAYTPREPANTAAKAAFAKAVYDGEVEVPGNKKFFFSKMSEVPDTIMSASKKKRRMQIVAATGEEGRVIDEGGFLLSSPQVFSHWKRSFHILPVRGEVVSRAIRGLLTPLEERERPWLLRFRNANIYRTYDDGISNAAACAWVALLKTGERVIFRSWKKSNLSISERATEIIEASGNRREQFRWHAIKGVVSLSPEEARAALRDMNSARRPNTYREIWETEVIRKTYADSKMFVRDPNEPGVLVPDIFRREGLVLDRAENVGPLRRYEVMNDFLRVDHTRQHLVPGMGAGDVDDWGARLYFTNDNQDFFWEIEHLLHPQYITGAMKGEFNEKATQFKDNHLVDCGGYCCLARISWIDPSQYSSSPIHSPNLRAA